MNAKLQLDQQAITIRNLKITLENTEARLSAARQVVAHEAAKVAEQKEILDTVRQLVTDEGDPADILAAIKDVLK